MNNLEDSQGAKVIFISVGIICVAFLFMFFLSSNTRSTNTTVDTNPKKNITHKTHRSKPKRRKVYTYRTKGIVKIRSGPGTNYPVIRTSSNAEFLYLRERADDWLQSAIFPDQFVHKSVVIKWIEPQDKKKSNIPSSQIVTKKLTPNNHGNNAGASRLKQYIMDNVSHLAQTVEVRGPTVFIRIKDPVAARDNHRMHVFAYNMARLLSEYSDTSATSCSLYLGNTKLLEEEYTKPH